MNYGFYELFNAALKDFSVFFALSALIIFIFINSQNEMKNQMLSTVISGAWEKNKSIVLASFANFLGIISLIFLSHKVYHCIYEMFKFEMKSDYIIICINIAFISVILLHFLNKLLNLHTSSLLSLISALWASTFAYNGFSALNYSQVLKIFWGFFISIAISFVLAYILNKLIVYSFQNSERYKMEKVSSHMKIISTFMISFAHGLHDSQKYLAILAIISMHIFKNQVANLNNQNIIFMAVILTASSFFGANMIFSRRNDTKILKFRKYEAFCCDMATTISLFIMTFAGFPVSTTQNKISSIMGVTLSKGVYKTHFKIAKNIFISYIFNFVLCFLLSFIISKFVGLFI